jgi:glycosyltransferase involved in cell wall biosynthesis
VKVCLASWAPYCAGAEVAALRLGVGLQTAGCDVVVVLGTKGQAMEQMCQAGLRCIHIPLCLTNKWRFWSYLKSRSAFARLLDHENPDIVHANDLPTSQMVGEAARRRKIPRICHHRFTFGGPAIDWLNKFGAERHLFISRSLMDELTQASPVLKSSPHALVYDGIPIPPIPSETTRRESRMQLGLPIEKTIVTFAGQVIERKGVAELIQAWHLLPRDVADRSLLLIIGEDMITAGAYRREMERLAARLNVQATFTGFQENTHLWWQASDIAVVPSRVEPLGLVALEAMAAELPVIGCAVGGIRETVAHGETGLLVPAANAIRLAEALTHLLGSAEQRRVLGAAGRKRCEEKFSLESHVRQVLAQYESVLREQHA